SLKGCLCYAANGSTFGLSSVMVPGQRSTAKHMTHQGLPIDRRRFLRRTIAAVGGAVAAPAFVPASVLGRAGSVPPSERITMGFVGVGTQGGGHLLGGAWTYVAGGYAGRKDVQVLAVCDVWRERRERACQRVNDNYANLHSKGSRRVCEAYTDFREVLARA